MQNLGFPNHFKSRPGAGAAKTFSLSSRSSYDSHFLRSFANLKLTAAEKCKEFFEGKVSDNFKAIESLIEYMDGLSLKLTSAEETIRKLVNEKQQIQIVKEENDRFYKDERRKTANLIEEKDALIKQFESTVAANKQAAESLNSRMVAVQLELRSKEDEIKGLLTTQENLEKENSKINELQKAQESVMAQLSGECHLARQRIRKLESEAENLVSKKIETEKLVSELEKKIDTLSKSSRSSENKMQDLLLKISAMEMDSKYNTEKMQAEMQGKKEEIDNLEKEREKHEVRVDSLEKQVGKLQVMVEEKEQLILQFQKRENKLEVQISEVIMAAAESKLVEARKQYDVMLESKKLELSRHLKEISQRNDQAINDIRRKYDMEKQEIVKLEKEKADKVVGEMEQKCQQKVAKCKGVLMLHFIRIQETKAALVTHLQQEHDRKVQNLKADHHEELMRAQIQAEDELRKETTSVRNEHEVQVKALRCEFEARYKKLQEELSLQKSKENSQRALLQMPGKMVTGKSLEEQEVNTRRDYSNSSVKRKAYEFDKLAQHALVPEEEKESPFLGATQTLVAKLLKKADNARTGSVMNILKHRKVTHHENGVETSIGSPVLSENRRKRKKFSTSKANTPRSFIKGTKGSQPKASNISDLFSEGSLNPCADDPYAFDYRT